MVTNGIVYISPMRITLVIKAQTYLKYVCNVWKKLIRDLSSIIMGDVMEPPKPERAGADRSSSLKHGKPLTKFRSCGPLIGIESAIIACAPAIFNTTTDLDSNACATLAVLLQIPICKRQLQRLSSRIDVSDKKARIMDNVDGFYSGECTG